MNITDSFISFLRSFSKTELSDKAIHQIKRCLLDYMGIVNAGAKEAAPWMSEMMVLGSDGACTVWGCDKRVDIHTAGIINGFFAHVIELDDGHRFGAPHLEATIITAMIAVAQKESLSFEQFVKGILVGYEVTVRLSTAMQPSHKLRGFHATGTCGTIGVACAVGYALGLDDKQMKGALSAAATSASGLLQVIDDDSQLKPYNVANAVNNGIIAAYIGRSGLEGPDDVLGGKRGFLNAFALEYKLEKIVGKSEILAINQIYVKPYAACRHAHAPIECVLEICKQHAFEAADIAEIEVSTYKLAIFGHDKTTVSSASAAKMSTPYSVAAAVILGSCGIEAFQPSALSREDIKNLMKKVRVIENEVLTAASPAKRGAIVTIRMTDERSYTNKVEYPLGEPEHNMSDIQLEEKYESLMTYAGISREKRDYIKKMIWNLEDYYSEFINM